MPHPDAKKIKRLHEKQAILLSAIEDETDEIIICFIWQWYGAIQKQINELIND